VSVKVEVEEQKIIVEDSFEAAVKALEELRPLIRRALEELEAQRRSRG